MSGFGTEKDQDRRRKRLKALLQLPCNRTCCDCNQRQPQWASVNLGLFFCIRCSGIHRNLGVHISVVRSITLDSWKEDWVNMLEQVGNERGNSFWETRSPGPRKPDERASDHQLEQFIRDKYVRGLWRGNEQDAPHLASNAGNGQTLQQQPLSSPTPSIASSTQSTSSQRLPQQSFTPQPSAQHHSLQFQRSATDNNTQPQLHHTQSHQSQQQPQQQQQQQQQHQATRRGQTTSLSQSNSGIRQPTTQPQSHLQQTNPANPFGRLESNSNQVVPTSNPTNKPKSNPAPQLDMDFESFFQDDQPKANGSANQSQQSQMGSPLADLFSPSGTTTNTANNSVNATPQSAPAPHVSGNDPFALLSQPGIVEQPKDKKTDSILSLYNNPTPQQHPPHLQNNNGMQSPYGNQPQQQQHQQFSQNYGQQLQHHQQQQQQQHYANPQMGQMNMMGSPYGYAQPNQMMYGQPMPMHMNANPYAQPQMQHPNSNVAFGGTYSYAAPAQSGLQKQNNNTSSGQNFDVFAGFM